MTLLVMYSQPKTTKRCSAPQRASQAPIGQGFRGGSQVPLAIIHALLQAVGAGDHNGGIFLGTLAMERRCSSSPPRHAASACHRQRSIRPCIRAREDAHLGPDNRRWVAQQRSHDGKPPILTQATHGSSAAKRPPGRRWPAGGNRCVQYILPERNNKALSATVDPRSNPPHHQGLPLAR